MDKAYYGSTLAYYDQNADDFCSNTADADMQQIWALFLSKLKKNAYVLDFGCGSGRDTKYFISRGLTVDAVDGSAQLCRRAAAYTGIQVRQMYFQDLAERDKYDGIWACASILHLPYDELAGVLEKMKIAVKQGGVIYTSFKYGSFHGIKNGRYFTYLTEESFEKLLQEIGGLEIDKEWITSDVRPGRGEEKWLNLILRKS